MRTLLLLCLALTACGSKPMTTVDAGPDTSCGLDCAAQTAYGLTVNRCFEYSTDTSTKQDPPALGVWVRPVFTLEGGVKVLPVEYRIGGQIKMIDDFGIVNGELRLMRREFTTSGQSVTYKTGSAITGVKWLAEESAPGENYSTTADAFVVGSSGSGTTDATTYHLTTSTPGASELKTPLQTFTTGVKMLPGETPSDHGSDTRRIWVPGTGFVLIATPLALSGGSSTPYVLQRVRDPGTPDGGAEDCSLGSP